MTTKSNHKNIINGIRSDRCGKHFKLVDGKFVQVEQKKKKTIQLDGTAAFSTTEVSRGGYQGEYKDQIVYNEDGSVDAYIRGQKTGRDDHLMAQAVDAKEPIHILHRRKNGKAFTFIGSGTGSVVRDRVPPVGVSTENVYQMNLFRVHIPRAEVRDRVCNVPRIGARNMYKIGGLREIGFMHTTIQTCFYRQ